MQIAVCRVAKPSDAKGIFAVLEEVAPKIPLLMEGEDRKGELLKLVQECCDCGESWVAIGDAGRIVGFLLAKPNKEAAFFEEKLVLDLAYGGVTKSERGKGVFRALIAKVRSRNVPLKAIVKHANQCDMADRFLTIGFKKVRTDSQRQEDHFVWEP